MTRITKIERKIEYLPIVGEMKTTNDTLYQMEGYLNYVGNIDFGDDRTMAGAFKRTLQDSYSRKSSQGLDFLWPYLWNHDYNIPPPGGIYDADEDQKGLFIKVQFNPDIQLGRELYSSYKMGTLKKNSMGYKAIQYQYVKEGGRSIRDLLEVAIMEGSSVVFPMNDKADTTIVKNASGKRTFVMGGTPPARKDFNDSYLQRQQSDWLDDLYLPWYALKQEIINAFQIGDQPVDDTKRALDQFSTAMLAYVQQGVDLGMVDALQPDDDSSGSMPAVYGYMSREENEANWQAKEGRMLSAANHTTMTKAVQGIMGHCGDLNKMLAAAKPDKGAETPLARKDGQDDAVSTQIGELLTTIEISNLKRNLR